MKKPTFALTLTQAQYSAASNQLAKLGLKPESGTLPEESGVVLSYVSARIGLEATVVFTVEKKPVFAPVGLIQNKVKAILGIA